MSDTDSDPPPEVLPAERKSNSAPLDSDAHNILSVIGSIKRSGPLPDAREFARYETTLPGAADRILQLAEKQANHRMEMERAVIFGGVFQQKAGLACATTVVLATLGLTAYMASIHEGLWGLAAVLGEISAIAGAFVYSTKKNSEERIRKQKMRERQPDTPDTPDPQ